VAGFVVYPHHIIYPLQNIQSRTGYDRQTQCPRPKRLSPKPASSIRKPLSGGLIDIRCSKSAPKGPPPKPASLIREPWSGDVIDALKDKDTARAGSQFSKSSLEKIACPLLADRIDLYWDLQVLNICLLNQPHSNKAPVAGMCPISSSLMGRTVLNRSSGSRLASRVGKLRGLASPSSE
jgi:hypothetical protein